MIVLRLPLSPLASLIPRQEIEASVAHLFAHSVRFDKTMLDVDLFCSTASLVGAGVTKAGRPSLLLRLRISLLYVKHAFNVSDEGLVERWAGTPIWQYLSGLECFEHRWPCDPTAIGKFRCLLGGEAVVELLAQTINVAVTFHIIAKKNLAWVIFIRNVLKKVLAHSAETTRMDTMNDKTLKAAIQAAGLEPMQSYGKKGQGLSNKSGIATFFQLNYRSRFKATIDNIIGD